MKLTDWMDEKGLCVGVTLKEKEGVVDILAALQQKCGNTERSKQLRQEMYYREEEVPYAIGAGVAVCYLKTATVKKPLITAVTVPAGIDLHAPDGENSRLVFLAAVPCAEKCDPTPKLTVLLMNENLREQLMDAADEHTFMELMRLAEEGEYPAACSFDEKTALVLAVVDEETESATEAAAQLQLAAGRMGMLLKIERVGNPIFSDEDLREAEGVLLIGNEQERDRFDGKPVLEISVSDGIYRPEHLLRSVCQAPVFHKKIKLKVRKKGLEDWYYCSNVPLLPLILFAGGLLMLAGELCLYFNIANSVADALRWVGERSLLLLVPRVCGMLGFRYARWPGLAVGLIGGGVIEVLCGGAWAALLGGAVTVLVMQSLERGINYLPAKLHWLEWVSPVVGVAAVTGLAFLLKIGADWIQKGFLWLSGVGDLRLKGLLFGLGLGLDPGGPLDRAALSTAVEPGLKAALAAGGLALAVGLTVFSVLCRKRLDKVHCASGWTAFPAGLCGVGKSYLVFLAGDPFRTSASAACGSGAAGLLAASLGCMTEKTGLAGALSCTHPFRFWIAVLCGASLCCALLFVLWHEKQSPHEV